MPCPHDSHEPRTDWSLVEWGRITPPVSASLCAKGKVVTVGQLGIGGFPKSCKSWMCRFCGPRRAEQVLDHLCGLLFEEGVEDVFIVTERTDSNGEQARARDRLRKQAKRNGRGENPPHGGLVVPMHDRIVVASLRDCSGGRSRTRTSDRFDPGRAFDTLREHVLVPGLVVGRVSYWGQWKPGTKRALKSRRRRIGEGVGDIEERTDRIFAELVEERFGTTDLFCIPETVRDATADEAFQLAEEEQRTEE